MTTISNDHSYILNQTDINKVNETHINSKSQTFKLDFSQYISLICSSYNTICILNRGFKENISHSMYQYYCVILLWRRIYEILSHCSAYRKEAFDFDLLFQYSRLQVPKDINLYLSGLGNITDFNSCKVNFLINSRCTSDKHLDSCGSFGKIDHLTHILYETIPSPLVSLMAIMEDMRSKVLAYKIEWKLPDQVAPDSSNSLLVNSNLLCWSPAYPVTPTQYTNLINCGFIINISFGVDRHVDNIPINRNLLNLISQHLFYSKFDLSVPENTNKEGSLSQCLFVTPCSTDIIVNRYINSSSRIAYLESPFNFDSSHIRDGVAFRYRFQRKLFEGDVHSLCYLTHTKQAPSTFWLNNENEIFDSVPNGWNTNTYNGPRGCGLDSAQAVSCKMLNR